MADEYIKRKDALDALTADALERNLDSVMTDTASRYHRAAQRVVSIVPAADVRPVRHGRWLCVVKAVVDTTGICSNCCEKAVWRTRKKPYAICPNCGADTREVDDG